MTLSTNVASRTLEGAIRGSRSAFLGSLVTWPVRYGTTVHVPASSNRASSLVALVEVRLQCGLACVALDIYYLHSLRRTAVIQ
eukprot:scaffold2979_cov405-Prasinococcus_capsulatus_cf.AAC.6